MSCRGHDNAKPSDHGEDDSRNDMCVGNISECAEEEMFPVLPKSFYADKSRQFTIKGELGEGGGGTVKLVVDKETKKEFAMKIFHDIDLQKEAVLYQKMRDDKLFGKPFGVVEYEGKKALLLP